MKILKPTCLIVVTLCFCVIALATWNTANSFTAYLEKESKSPRYIQIDHEKNVLKFGTSMTHKGTVLLDTKSGDIIEVSNDR